MTRLAVAATLLLLFTASPARAASTCDPDGTQTSGSKYRICMPDAADYNGMLVVWAHGFQDATEPVGIPEDQLCLSDGFCLNEVINTLGFGFATNSYSKTGLAVLQGKSDLLDLVGIYSQQKGTPTKVYIVGASEGGLITALSVEQRPDVYSAGMAACGPVGDFPAEINYFGDARATFQYFFPGVIPGDPFHPDDGLVGIWPFYYDLVVEPLIFAPANADRLNEWARVASLPFDTNDYINSLKVSVRDALRYSVVNINDAGKTLGGFPFDNSSRWYAGSSNDLLLNLFVPRAAASPTALATMIRSYNTTGVLARPLITLHTLRDQQVPYWHEQLYDLKTLFSGSFLTRHLNIPIDRFEHCNFTPAEALVSFLVMLVYDGLVPEISGVNTLLSGADLKAFERHAQSAGLPYQLSGDRLRLRLRKK
jgi:hypothetical protein